ncbi:unnamed protein product [Rhizophagus irregularis]|uniref:Uncharacterized protein n=1 Tax=Rhizophagus irregularis TaxID=588596 RepID=A0A915ZDS6_9GLOM|nr:unnamed protein product [Rhizophagus irregularis]
MGDQLQTLRACRCENARELFRRVTKLGRIQSDRRDPVEPGLGGLQRGKGIGFVEMAQEAQDQQHGHAVLRLRLGNGGEQPGDDRVEGNAACGVRLRIEHDFGVDDAIGGGAIEIGGGEIMEILRRPQHVRPGIINVEKVLQPREVIRRADILDARERDRDLVALGQREHQFGLKTALDMQMEFGLGQARDEVGIGHGGTIAGLRAVGKRRTTIHGTRFTR